ncbi:MAG: FecR domain-containing protein [Pseudomonadota bacterium]|nr:FecR domain-containing protein [Pseudomonadota bacterium]
MTEVIDFPDGSAIEEQAAEWLIRLDGDRALSSEEHQNLRRWLARSPAYRDALFRLAELWNKMNVLSELAVLLDNPAEHSESRWVRPVWLTAVAATILAVVGLVVFVGIESPLDSNGLYATAVGQQRVITLADGSIATLNTDSQIRVSYGEAYRDVRLLRGEAHFDVTDNERLPLRVSAGDHRIRALGTAFSVYMRNGSVDVTVSEGIVVLERISPADAPVEITASAPAPVSQLLVTELGILSAGQVATIPSSVSDSGELDSLRNFVSLESPEILRRLSWTEGVLQLSGESLEEVVREISRYTTAEIEFSDPEVGAIRIGGRFPIGETEMMFETLESNFGLRVTYSSEDHILISAGE